MWLTPASFKLGLIYQEIWPHKKENRKILPVTLTPADKMAFWVLVIEGQGAVVAVLSPPSCLADASLLPAGQVTFLPHSPPITLPSQEIKPWMVTARRNMSASCFSSSCWAMTSTLGTWRQSTCSAPTNIQKNKLWVSPMVVGSLKTKFGFYSKFFDFPCEK